MSGVPTHEAPVAQEEAARAGMRLARLGLVTAMVSRLLGRLVGILLVIVLARVASDTTVAVYGYLLATAALMITLTDLGVASVAGREVAAGRLPADGAVRAALPPQLASVAVAAAATVLTTAALGPGSVPRSALVLAVLYVVAGGLGNLWAEVIRASGRVVLEGSVQLVSSVLLVAVGVWVVVTGGGATALLSVVLVKEVLLLSVFVAVLRPRRRAEARTRFLLGHGIWMAVASTAIVLLWRQGTIVVGGIGSVTMLATYVVGTRVLDAGITVAHTAGFGLLPGMSALEPHPAAFRRAALRYLGLAAAAGVLVAVAGALLAEPLTSLVFGSGWTDAVPTVRMAAFSAVPILLLYVCFTLVAARRQMRLLGLASVAGSLVGVLATALFLQWWSDPAGAVAGTAVGAATVVVIVLVGLRDLVGAPRQESGRHLEPAT